ncbi:hypothetical protein [Desulfocurvus sp. DL9XJH121]
MNTVTLIFDEDVSKEAEFVCRDVHNLFYLLMAISKIEFVALFSPKLKETFSINKSDRKYELENISIESDEGINTIHFAFEASNEKVNISIDDHLIIHNTLEIIDFIKEEPFVFEYVDYNIKSISYSSPFKVTIAASFFIITLALVISGGKMNFSYNKESCSLEIELPPIHQSVRAFDEIFNISGMYNNRYHNLNASDKQHTKDDPEWRDKAEKF